MRDEHRVASDIAELMRRVKRLEMRFDHLFPPISVSEPSQHIPVAPLVTVKKGA